MFVALSNISPPVTDLNTIAGWFLGTIVVLIVAAIFAALGIWISGRSFNVSEWSMKGKIMLGMCVLASMLVGSIVPALGWSSNEDMTTSLLPDGAGKRDVRIDTEAPASKCQTKVGLKAEQHRKAKTTKGDQTEYSPTDAEANEIYQVIKSLGARDLDADKVKTKTVAWGSRTGDLPSADDWKDDWSSYKEEHEPMYSAVSWQPDGMKGACNNKNHHAAKGAKIEVIVFEKFTKATGDPGKPNYTKAEYGYRWFEIPVK